MVVTYQGVESISITSLIVAQIKLTTVIYRINAYIARRDSSKCQCRVDKTKLESFPSAKIRQTQDRNEIQSVKVYYYERTVKIQ